MRLSAFLLFAVCLQVSATTYSQTVSYTGKNVGLKSVFAAVKKQTGYGIFYENGETMLQSTAPVTLNLKNVSLDLFLRTCLKDQPLDYSLEGTTIFIRHKESSPNLTSSPIAPISEIKGRVTNTKGEPLVNANITIKRTGHGTITDANGNFTLRNISSEDFISVTFIGYKAQSIPVRDRSSLTLVMEAATNELDKVVVQAYGTTSQRLATGNIGVVRAEDIEKQPVMNVLEAIQGQVAGVVVTNNNGYSSGTVKVEIRGRNTISQDFPSDPLYIIDGVPLTILNITASASYASGSPGVMQSGVYSPANGQSPFFSINPADIESIEILKDADATAIYGSRGSNGVILVTTKKGKSGKNHFDLSVHQGISEITRFYPMLNTQQYISLRKEALKNDNLPVNINTAPDLVAWDTSHYTNWQKYLWGRKGKITDIESSLSGGDNRITYRVGAGFRSQQDILAASGGNYRGSLSLNLNTKSLNQRFTFSISAFYTFTQSDLISNPSAVLLPPDAPAIFTKKGDLNFSGWAPLQNNLPFGVLLQPYSAKTNVLNTNMTLGVQIVKGLQFKTSLGYNNIQGNHYTLRTIASQNPQYNPKGSANFGYTFIHNIIVEPQLEYNGQIGKGKLNILLGATGQKNVTDGILNTGIGYTNDALMSSVSQAPSKSSYETSGQYRYSAAFTRINYNLEDKYIINLTGRRDGSSRFGPGKQYGNFGAVGAAWIFTEEKLLKNKLSFLSLGKIRGSYGITGGDQVQDYSYLSLWAFGNGQYNNTVPLSPQNHVDSLLHWEVNKKLELALTLGLLNDRITVEGSWYRNRCGDQLVPFPTPNFTGFSGVSSNLPAEVQNTGFELNANGKIINTTNFKWSCKFVLGINRNKLIAFPGLSQSPFAGVFIVGRSLNIIKLLHWTGVDQQTGNYTFLDRNKNGNIDIDYTGITNDDRFVYNLNPKYDGGFGSNFSYKNFELSLYFYFRKQIGYNATSSVTLPGAYGNQPIEVLNRWQKPGDITNIARLTTQYTPEYRYYKNYSDANLTDASFVRLQNLSLSYKCPGKFLSKAGIANFQIYLKGQNLFLITKYKGIDPEAQNFGGLPLPRILTAGITCSL